MKRKLSSLVLAGALLLSAMPASAEDDFYVIPTRATPGTSITRLPLTITASGYYYFTRNLTATSSNGITVNASNVTIDLMGFVLSGPGTNNYVGILIFGSNVEVRNGTVTGWQTGISSAGVGSRAIGVRAVDNNDGIHLSNDALIKSCTASPFSTSSGFGLAVISGTISGCTVMDFMPDDNTQGQIYFGLGTGGRARGNLVLNCGSTGIKSASGNAAITGNVVVNCKYGIDLSGGGSLVANSVVANSGQTALIFGSDETKSVVADQNSFCLQGANLSSGTFYGTWGLNGGGAPPPPSP